MWYTLAYISKNAAERRSYVCLNLSRFALFGIGTAVPRPADVEGCFGILFSLLFKTDNPTAAVPGLSMEIATKVLEKIDDRAPLRLKL